MKSKFLLIASAVFGIDILTKSMAVSFPWLEGYALLPRCVRVSHAFNSGLFFRLFDDLSWIGKPYLLAGISLAAVGAALWWSTRQPSGHEPLQTALALSAGGLLGNSADRIFYGAVFDFIEVHFENSIYYPTFNIADVAITGGLFLIAIHFLIRGRTHGGLLNRAHLEDRNAI